MKKSKSAEVLSSLGSRADEKVKPVIPPRPTVEALANAKRSPIVGRYVEVDLSGDHATLQDAQGNGSPKLVLPVKENTLRVKDTHTVNYAALKFAQRSPLSSRDAVQGSPVTQTGNATTTQRAARAPAFENSPSSVQRSRSRSPGKKSSAVDDHKQKRLRRGRRVTVINKVTVINTCTKEAESKPATSLVPRTTKRSSHRNSATSEYDYPAEDILLRPSWPPTLQVARTEASSPQPRAPCSPPRRSKHHEKTHTFT